MCFVANVTPSLVLLQDAKMYLDRVSSEQSCDFILCEPKGLGDHQAGDCCVNSKDQEITRLVIVV